MAQLSLLCFFIFFNYFFMASSMESKLNIYFEEDHKVGQTIQKEMPPFPYKSIAGLPSIHHDLETCTLDPALIEEIQGYQDEALAIIEAATKGNFKGRTYSNLARFVDKFGPRVSGTKILEESIDHMMQLMTNYSLTNVHGEEVVVPHYYRGEEMAEMILPRKKNIPLMGFVPSVGTPEEGITAEVFVVKSFDDLTANADKAVGKIVVFNQDFVSYGATVSYRKNGAVAAARVGAVASLVRSITPFSIDAPHTGGMSYEAGVNEIPCAGITVEDAQFLYRLQQNGDTIKIHLKMLNYKLPPTTSRNVFGEIRGWEKPHEIVAVSGHIDSWDFGQGAMDDAGGVFISVEALALLQELGYKPRRTLSAILWTSEEVGLVGVADYVNKHEADLTNYSAVFESDGGTFHPRGLQFAGSEEAGCIVNEILKLLTTINGTTYSRHASVSSDITKLIEKGVPGLSLNNANDNYFWYHHTSADTMTIQDSDEMDLCTALWAVTSYVIADLSIALPREMKP